MLKSISLIQAPVCMRRMQSLGSLAFIFNTHESPQGGTFSCHENGRGTSTGLLEGTASLYQVSDDVRQASSTLPLMLHPLDISHAQHFTQHRLSDYDAQHFYTNTSIQLTLNTSIQPHSRHWWACLQALHLMCSCTCAGTGYSHAPPQQIRA